LNRDQINKQAQVLRAKKIAKSAIGNIPKVQAGVVKIDIPSPKVGTIKSYGLPHPPERFAKKKDTQKVKQPPKSTSQPAPKKGCTGCRRKSHGN
jgi:hypothetical protein